MLYISKASPATGRAFLVARILCCVDLAMCVLDTPIIGFAAHKCLLFLLADFHRNYSVGSTYLPVGLPSLYKAVLRKSYAIWAA